MMQVKFTLGDIIVVFFMLVIFAGFYLKLMSDIKGIEKKLRRAINKFK